MKFEITVTATISGIVAALIASSLVCLGEARRHPKPGTREFYTVPDSQMAWGKTTNFERGDWAGRQFPGVLKIGIRAKNRVIVLAGDPLKEVNPASVYAESLTGPPIWTVRTEQVGGVSTNRMDPTNLVLTFLPPADQRCAINMVDAESKPVPKTGEGQKLGQPPTLRRSVRFFRWNEYDCQCAVFFPYSDDELYSIDPTKYFVLKKPGMYKLTLVQRLYIVDTNANLRPIELPAVSINVEVKRDK